MYLFKGLPAGHGFKQPINNQRHNVRIQQVINQPGATVALGATFGQVINQRLAIGEVQMTTRQPFFHP